MSNIIYNPSINHKTENDDLNFNKFADVEVLPSSIEGSLSQGNKLISDIIHYGIVWYIGLFLSHGFFLGGGGGGGGGFFALFGKCVFSIFLVKKVTRV